MWKLYVLGRNGAFKCFRCNAAGSWFDFQNKLLQRHGTNGLHAETAAQATAPTSQPSKGLRDREFGTSQGLKTPVLLDGSQYIQQAEALLKDAAGMEYLTGTEGNQRGLSLDTIKKYKAASSPDDLEMVRYKVRAMRDKSKMRLQPKGGGWGFFGWHLVKEEHSEIILTEGEFDAMAVSEGVPDIPAVSLPNGASSLPPELLPVLERFNKVYLWMDNDAVGQEAIRKFAAKLGRGRCLIVGDGSELLPEGSALPKDANDALKIHGPDLVRRMVYSARRLPHSRVVGFEELRGEILHELLHPDQICGVKCQSLPQLDKIVKGHRRGELTIVTGPTGCGKTTLLSQLSLDYCRQGINTLWGSFEIRNSRLGKKMLMQHAAASMEMEVSSENFSDLADRFEELPLYFLNFHGSSDVDEVLDAMEYAAYAHDVEHVVLDNLQFMLSGQGRGYDRFDMQDRSIEKFRRFSTRHNIHVTLVIHPRKEADNEPLGMQSVFGGAKATQEADNIWILQHVVPHGTSASVKYLEVKKNRFDGDLGSVHLRFDRQQQSFVTRSDAEIKAMRTQKPG